MQIRDVEEVGNTLRLQHTEKFFANLFDHGVAVLAFVIAAKVRDEK